MPAKILIHILTTIIINELNSSHINAFGSFYE